MCHRCEYKTHISVNKLVSTSFSGALGSQGDPSPDNTALPHCLRVSRWAGTVAQSVKEVRNRYWPK